MLPVNFSGQLFNYRVIGWKVALIMFGAIGLYAAVFARTPGFWTSYALDVAGPAWNYILIRGQYSAKDSTFFSLKFTPESAVLLILGICLLIETSQYFNLYAAHFDPWDYPAYISGLLPCYLIDKWIMRSGQQAKENQ